MKTNVTIVVCVVIALLTAGSASAWLDTYSHRQSINLTGGSSGVQTDYQITLSIPYTSAMQGDFDDARFTQADGETLIDSWLESKVDDTSAEVWVEFPTTPASGANQTYYMYYGNAGAASDWDGAATFLQYHGAASATFNDSNILPSSALIYEAKVRRTSGSEYLLWGVGRDDNLDAPASDGCSVMMYSGTDRYLKTANDGTGTSVHETNTIVLNQWYRAKMVKTVSDLQGYFDDDAIGAGLTSHLINEACGLAMTINSGTGEQEWSFARKYAANPPTAAFGSEEAWVSPSTPSISAYNNVTFTKSHVPLAYGTTVLFNASTGNGITWSWTLDGADQATPYDNYTHTFATGFGYYAVTVTATNAAGTDTYTWGIWENIETTAETIPTFTDTSYQMLLDSIDYPPDMEEFGKAMAHPFVQMVGVIFYLFIFGVPLLMMYIRQDNMTMPTTLLLLFGSIIIFMLPPQWQIIAGALMTLGFVGILFKLYKERER